MAANKMPSYRPTWLEISGDALRHNIAAARAALPRGMRLMAVVKANAYGHGAVETARGAVEAGADSLGVAFLDEAVELRAAGITAPVLVLGYTPAEGVALAAERGIALTAYSAETLDALAHYGAAHPHGPAVKAHIKLDTGMGRLGERDPQRAVALIERALSLPQVEVEGLYTHYACADETDKSFTVDQYRRFTVVVDHFSRLGIDFQYIHAGNSATAMDCPELAFNMVRFGIGMYGLYPSPHVDHARVRLRPMMRFVTQVVMLKTVPPNTPISYGAIYRTQRTETIATLPVGYADGFSRMLTARVHVLVRGRRVPVVGRICMDQCMIDVTDVPGVELGDEVVLIGEQGEERITVDEWAELLGTINYEVVCMISSRVPRVYLPGDTVRNS